MTRGRRVGAWLLLVAALVLTIQGQRYFFYRPDFAWDGLVLHILGAACFLLAWRLGRPAQARPSGRRWQPALPGWLAQWPIPTGLLALGALLALAAGLLARDRAPDQASGDVALLWALGTAAAALAALVKHPGLGWPAVRRRVREWPARFARLDRAARLEVAVVAGLTLVAFLVRGVALGQVPFTLGGDEAWHGLLARQVLNGQLRNPFSMGYMSMPTLFYWPLSWSLWLAGNDVAALRLPAALAGAATVPILYLFARGLWERRVALLAAAFLATYDYHLHYSRLGANNIWDALFVLLALWALDRGLARSTEEPQTSEGAAWRSFVAAGLIMGLGVYFYTGARLLPILTLVYAGYVWIRQRGRAGRLGLHLGLLALALLIAAAPMLAYARVHPNEWNARVNQVGIIQSGWLEREVELTGKGAPQLLAEQFLRAAGAFHVFPDRTVWYGADRPLLSFGAGILAVLGMAWAVAHWRRRGDFLLLLWFWAVIVTGGMLTESPPSSQRLVIASPAVAILVALGMDRAVHLGWRLLVLPRAWERLALVLLIVALGAANLRYYFYDLSPLRHYGGDNGQTATMMGTYLRDVEPGTTAYLFGAPRLYWSFGTIPFLAPAILGQDVVEPLTAPPALDAGRPSVYLFLPERSAELAFVQQALPGGRVLELHDPAGQLRFIVYEPGGKVPVEPLRH
ncbi:MAG: glycosyltransferase family 39 protein [Anaerolineae bacterium]|nr:glycosyltransferase family 39 protein [Anaerolineae bacterium]